jgi:hypothetical protein
LNPIETVNLKPPGLGALNRRLALIGVALDG